MSFQYYQQLSEMISELKPTERIKAKKWVQRLQQAQGKEVKITLKYFKLLTLQLEAIKEFRLKTLDPPFCYLPKLEALPDLPQLYFDRYQKKHSPEVKQEKIDSRRCQRFDMQVLTQNPSYNQHRPPSHSPHHQNHQHIDTQKVQEQNLFASQSTTKVDDTLQDENYDVSSEDNYYQNTAILSSENACNLDELEYTFLSSTIQQLKFI